MLLMGCCYSLGHLNGDPDRFLDLKPALFLDIAF